MLLAWTLTTESERAATASAPGPGLRPPRRPSSLVTCGTAGQCGTLGAVVSRQRYSPYGRVRDSSGTMPTDFGFAGQRRDTGLMYYNARYYDAALGRFVSADTIVPSAGNPQSLNRFTYTNNNPIRYSDPSGHDGCDVNNMDGTPDGCAAMTGGSAFQQRATYWQNAASAAAEDGGDALQVNSLRSAVSAQAADAEPAPRQPQVAVDTNVIIASIDKGRAADVDAALNGRAPVVSITAAKEHLHGGNASDLRNFMTSRGGRIGTAATQSDIQNLQSQATTLGRAVHTGDAAIAGSAIREGLPLLTGDTRLHGFLNAMNALVELFR